MMQSICVPLSFGTDAGLNSTAAAVRVYFPTRALVSRVRCTVTAQLNALDSGTVTLTDSDAVSWGTSVIPADTVIGTRSTITPATNLIVEADDYVVLTPTKTTAGGEVLCYVEWAPAVFTPDANDTGNSVG
jgi:hypothetical protein